MSFAILERNISANEYQLCKAAGGLISASLLATPGASAVYKGGLTVGKPFASQYDNPLILKKISYTPSNPASHTQAGPRPA